MHYQRTSTLRSSRVIAAGNGERSRVNHNVEDHWLPYTNMTCAAALRGSWAQTIKPVLQWVKTDV